MKTIKLLLTLLFVFTLIPFTYAQDINEMVKEWERAKVYIVLYISKLLNNSIFADLP